MIDKETLIFTLDNQFELSLNKLKDEIHKKQIKKICIKQFINSFRVDHQIKIQSLVREVKGIQKVKFLNTILNRENLNLFYSWLKQQQCIDFILYFNNNKLDDLEISEFIHNLLTGDQLIKQIYIINNIGIYKGQFISKLKQSIRKLNMNNYNFEYALVQDKSHYSICVTKFQFNDTQIQRNQTLELIKKKLVKTNHFQFSFNDTFNKNNFRAFEYLINLNFNERGEDRISKLSISNCFCINTQSVCEQLSTAKGLLELYLEDSQKFLTFSVPIDSLMGGRYHKLRVNKLGLEKNSSILEKTWKILSENIFLDVKILEFSSCLPQQLSTLYKFFVMIEAFQNQSQQLLQKSLTEGKIYQQNLKKLDLALLENYNRHDLIMKFLNSIAFNVTSNLKQLTFQNLDIGRAQAYLTAFENVRQKIQQLQETNQIYQDFKFKLKSVKLPKQTYRMEIPTMRRFFQEFFFTRVGNILEIEEFIMVECFKQANREEGLKENFAEIIQQIEANPNVQYSIKKVSFTSANYQFDSVTYRCLFLNTCFQIEELKIKQDEMQGEFYQYVEETNQFLKRQPLQFILPLKVLVLDQIDETKFYIGDILEFLIFHDKVQLKTLVLKKITILHSQQQLQDVEQYLKRLQKDKVFSLEELKISGFVDDVGILPFFQYVLLNKHVKLRKLTIEELEFQAIHYPLQEFICENKDLIGKPSESLIEFTMSKIGFEQSSSIQFILSQFLFDQNSCVKKFQIKNQIIGEQFSEALFNSYQDEQQIYQLKLKKLVLKNCNVESDVLSPFIYTSQLNIIKLKNCKSLDTGLQKSMDTYYQTNVKLYNKFAIAKFQLQDSIINDGKVFKWLMKEFVFNKNLQQLSTLIFTNCKLTNELIKFLEEQISIIKSKNKFKLRKIVLDKCALLSDQQMIDFFNILYSKNTESNEKKINKTQKQLSKEQQIQEYTELEEENQRNLLKKIDEVKSKLVSETLNKKELNLRNKILYNYEVFKPQFPQQLQTLSLNMSFQEVKPEDKQLIYQRLLSGLILHPENQVKELTMLNLDLVLFMDMCQQCLQYFAQYQQTCLKNIRKQKLQLKNLFIKSLNNQDRQSIDRFVNLFICIPEIDLEKIILENFKISLIKSILNHIENRSNYKINELTIITQITQEERLNEAEINRFFNLIIIEQTFPLEKLELIGLEFEKTAQINKKLFAQQIKHKNKQQENLLKQFKISIKEPQDLDIYMSVLEYILNAQNNSLEILKIQHEKSKESEKESEQSFFNMWTILNEKTQQVMKFKLKEIQILGKVKLDINFFQFFSKSLSTLEKLEIQQAEFKMSDAIKDAIHLIKRNKNQNLTLQIKEILGQPDACFKEFLFDKNVQATHLILQNTKNFESLYIKPSIYQLKSLKLDMGLIYSSQVRLKRESLKLISQAFIYNEDSNLEEFLLFQCQLKQEEIEALCQPAQEFRDRMIKQHKQSKVTLKLKQFSIYYSLYIGEIGCQRISEDMIFFDYINIERIDFLVTNFSDQMCLFFVQAAKNWLKFQQENNRKYSNSYPLNYLDIGRNEFIQSKEVWSELLQTLVFTDKSDQLQTFNIQFMAFNDETVSYLVEESLKYLNNKPDNFVFPVKKINFSQNNALTHKGWKNLFDNFFLHKKVHLIELNMISTMLDTEIKLNTIYECIKHRALQENNKKLTLEVFLCYNVSLKNVIYPYLQTSSKDYPKPKNLPVDIDYDSWKYGIFDGIPEEFGSILMLVNTIIHKRNEFIETNKWKKAKDVRFPNYHLNFHEHYLQILNNHLKRNKEESIIYLDLKTLDCMCQFFNYTTELPANPYPIRLIFSNEAIEYYNQSQLELKKLRIINIPFSRLEQISQFDILQIWQQIRKNKIPFNEIEIEYYLNDELIEFMLQKYTEQDILDLIKLLPPSRIRIENTLTLNALKGFLYIIRKQYAFQPSIIKFSYHDWLNTGIAYQLREYAYNLKARNQIQAKIKKGFYELSNLFVTQDKSYLQSDFFENLEINLKQNKNVTLFLSIFNFAYLLLIFILPFYDISRNYKEYNIRYFNLIFLILNSIYELLIMKKLQISNTDQNYQLKQDLLSLNKIQQMTHSFFEKLKVLFDSYLLVMFYQHSTFKFYTYLFILSLWYGFQLINLIYSQIRNKENAQTINYLYDLSVYGRNIQLEKYLNDIIPYNCLVIKNLYVLQRFKLFKKIIGKSINKQIYNNFIKLIFKDIPQIILLGIFIFMNEINNASLLYQISYLISLLSTFESLKNIVSYRPLMISQDDFELISKQMRKNYLKEKLSSLEKESKQLEIYNNIGIKK